MILSCDRQWLERVDVNRSNSSKDFFIFIRGTFLLALLMFGVIVHSKQHNPMKILMIVGSFPVIHDICILNQITGLIDRGHIVNIFAFSKGDCVNVQEDVIKYNLINKTIFKKLPSDLNNYDIVMFQFGHKLFDIRKEHNFKGKIVVCFRGYDITKFLKENPHVYDQYFGTCDLFMPVCEAFKTILVNLGCSRDKIIVHHSAIDCSRFKFKTRKLPKDGTINIVSAGRFIEKKGFIYSIKAVAQLLKKYSKIRYTIIGDGVLKEEYKALIAQLHLDNKIKIEGWRIHDDYIAILKKAHMFIAPSIVAQNNDQEGIPNVLKEAMAMGLLVVATDHSGNSELIKNGVSGFLVPERDSDAIYDTIEYLLNNQHLWSQIQKAAIEKIRKNFNKKIENNKLEAILYNLLK